MGRLLWGIDMEVMITEPRSPHWAKVSHEHLIKQPLCLLCNAGPRTDLERSCNVGVMRKIVTLNVHHKFPFHFVVALGRPDLELDERNLYTLCVEHDEEHHLLVGHLGDYKSYNPWLEHHIALFRGLLASQIKATHTYQFALLTRPKPLHEMNEQERKKLREQLDCLFPITAQSSQPEMISPGSQG